jgi:ribosomal protein S18 acetylase RimI-like enzyme
MMGRDKTAHWRAMAAVDLPAVEQVADIVHPAYPEAAEVFAERLRLYPAGCCVLDGQSGILGYAIGHPWLFGEPPSLGALLGRLPAAADTFYIHDVALLLPAQGCGFGNAIVQRLWTRARAEKLDELSLVSVGGSQAFWEKLGFRVVEQAAIRTRLLPYGAASSFMARRV